MSHQADCDCAFRNDNSWEYDCTKPRRRRSARGYKGRTTSKWSLGLD